MSDSFHYLHRFIVVTALAKVSILALKVGAIAVVAGVAAFGKWRANNKRRQSH